MANQYAERDIMGLDKQGDHYSRHLSAMTGEGLHDKSDIAAELAYRDARIAQLEADCAAHKAAEKVQIALRQKADERTQELVAQIDRLDSELQEKALTDDGVIADAYWNCADKITPWLGEKTGPDTLINSVCGSLDFLIEQWREKKTLEQDRERRDLIKQAESLEKLKNVADVEYGTTGVAVDIAAVLEIAAELRQQAEQC